MSPNCHFRPFVSVSSTAISSHLADSLSTAADARRSRQCSVRGSDRSEASDEVGPRGGADGGLAGRSAGEGAEGEHAGRSI